MKVKRRLKSEEIKRNYEWKMKKEAEESRKEAATPIGNKNDSSLPPAYVQASNLSVCASERDHEKTNIKSEVVKEELILEDYGDPNNSMEEQSPNETEADAGLKGETNSALPSGGIEGTFETVICGTSDIKIKQEVFEDESDPFRSSHEVHLTPSWSAVVRDDPHCALPISLDSPRLLPRTASTVRFPQNQFLKRISKRFNETFPSISNQMEHCMVEQPDESPNKFIDEPSRRSIALENINLLKTTPQGSRASSTVSYSATTTPGCSPTVTPNYSATIASNCSSATTSGYSAVPKPNPTITNIVTRPPHWMERIYVSLKNIPVENRLSTRVKVLELVKLIADENLNPTLVNFSVMSE